MYYKLFNDDKIYNLQNVNILANLKHKGNVEIISIINNLILLPNLDEFINLKILYCYDNQLTQLPELTNNIVALYCNNNQLTQLTKLPNKLNELYCQNNQLTKLPLLPDNLKKIFCNNNLLTQLPKLPDNLQYIDYGNNKKQFN